MSEAPDRSKQTVFFISQMGDDGSVERFHSDIVLQTIAKPAARALGFADAIRADEIERPGGIVGQVIERVSDGPAVIADLSGQNPNVFYEVALAHAHTVPLVQLVEHGEIDDLPFDVDDQRTITYRRGDFASYSAAEKRVEAQLKAVLKDPGAVDNPVLAAKRTTPFSVTATAETEPSMSDVVRAVRDVGRRLSRLERVSNSIRRGGRPLSQPTGERSVTVREALEGLGIMPDPFAQSFNSISGSYIGDGQEGREVELGSRPLQVWVLDAAGQAVARGRPTKTGFVAEADANLPGNSYRYEAFVGA